MLITEPNDIVKKDLKLILGFLWCLILHYQINDQKAPQDETDQPEPTKSAKQNLIEWINTKLEIYEKKCSNFNGDWKDGKLFATLVNAILPESFTIKEIEESKDPRDLSNKAMEIAVKRLSIPPLITVDEFLSDMMDEMSLMTFLSLFKNAKIKTLNENELIENEELKNDSEIKPVNESINPQNLINENSEQNISEQPESNEIEIPEQIEHEPTNENLPEPQIDVPDENLNVNKYLIEKHGNRD